MPSGLHFSSNEPVQSGDLFAGREHQRTALIEFPRSVLLLGEMKSGKTSLLLRIKADLLKVSGILPIFISLENPIFRHPNDIYRNIDHYLRSSLDKEDLGLIKEPPDEGLDIGHVIELLQEFEMLNHGCTVALLIDNIERNARLGRRSVQFYTDLRQLVENSPLSNRVIIIATADTSFLSLESGFISGLLHRLPPQYIQALAFEETRYLAEKAEEICCDPKRQTIVKFLFEQTGGHPCLIQDLLARALQVENSKSRPLLERIQQEAARISHSGTSYFSEFVQRINLEELTYLEALALNLVVDKWPISAKSMDRFKCAGLVKTEDATTDATPSCKLFFSWLKNNAGKLIQFSRSFLPRANDPTSVGQLLSRALPLAVGTRKINSEKEIQNLVQAILASHELPFKREASRGKYQGKTFRPDFIIDELDLAIEVKLVKDPSRITKLVDEIIVDREAYLSSFFTAIFLIYDLTGKVGDHEFFSSDNPYAKYIVL